MGLSLYEPLIFPQSGIKVCTVAQFTSQKFHLTRNDRGPIRIETDHKEDNNFIHFQLFRTAFAEILDLYRLSQRSF